MRAYQTKQKDTMKESIVTTKSKADKILVNSLFDASVSYSPVKYDIGKYKWLGSQKAHINAFSAELEAKAGAHIKAIWFERRTDTYGAYCQIMCLTKA